MKNVLTLAALVAVSACNAPLTATQQAEAQLAVAVVGATVPGAAQVFADGQLVCRGAQGIVAIINGATKKPVIVTGQSQQSMENICQSIGATGTALPPGTTTVQGQVVTVPSST